MAERKPKFFITHSFKNVDFAQRMANDLRANGLDGFFDVASVNPGDNFTNRISHGLEECDVYLPILSHASLASRWCNEEIDAAVALSNEPGRNGRPRIISVVIDDCQNEMPVFLRSRLFIDFTKSYDAAFSELLRRGFGIAPAQPPGATGTTAAAERSEPRDVSRTGAHSPIVLIGAAIVLILVLGGILFAVFSQKSQPPTPTNVAAAPAVIAPSVAPAIAPPALPPTALPKPTDTPVPSATSQAAPSVTPLPAPGVVPPTPTVAAPAGRIAFSVSTGDSSFLDGQNIWIMNADGSGAMQIIRRASQPALSPDGSRIAYFQWSNPIGIYVADLDANLLPQNPRLLVPAAFIIKSMAWSPDGQSIAYSWTSTANARNVSVRVVPAAGGSLTNVGSGRNPSWIKGDPLHLVVDTCDNSNHCGLFKMALDGSVTPIITDGGALPAVSPDGTRIVYQKTSGSSQLFVVSVDGKSGKALTTGSHNHGDATWSPDGKFIFYRSDESGTWAIWRMDADGSHPTMLPLPAGMTSLAPVNGANFNNESNLTIAP